MKNLLQLALAIVLLSSCKKLDELSVPGKNVVPVKNITSSVENLGPVFSGTNITWTLHPNDAGHTPLFTYLPGQNNGYCLLMIDNGDLNGQTPLHAFRFVSVDMQSKSSKIITVKAPNGNPADYSFGRVVRCIFGTDKKFYVATEGSPSGGGHLIQYDPNTQTAVDLGKPFKVGKDYLAIYSLNIGTDGALYGGSFGGDGQAMTFRYDYNSFYVDPAPLDNSSRYVAYISGDSRYTYAVCGKNNWILYAIDRQTGEKKVLKYNAGSGTPIDVASNTDAPYAHSVATHYKLEGFNITPLQEYYRPSTERMCYNPYAETDKTVPQVLWNDVNNEVSYKLASGQTGSIPVGGLHEDVYPAGGPMMYYNNRLYLVSHKQGLLGTYSRGEGFEKLGRTSMSIQSMALAPATSPDAGKIFLGGYPKGELQQYTPSRRWSVNLGDFGTTIAAAATATSNPGSMGLFQNADGSGINGSMTLMGMGYTSNGYIATAGNNDRITVSSGRELSMGSSKNGTVRNLYLPEFTNYMFQSFCMSADGNYAYVTAIPHNGNTGKIYKYNPATNSIAASWTLPLWDDMSVSFQVVDNDLLVGICGDTVFLFDLTTGQIIWKQALGQGQKIYALAIAPDHSVYINYMYRSAVNFKIVKYTFNTSDRKNVQVATAAVTELMDQDNDEKNKPTRMLVTTDAAGVNELYVAGLASLYRVSL